MKPPDRTKSRVLKIIGSRMPSAKVRIRIRLATTSWIPPGVDVAHQRVRSAAAVLPPDRPFKDAAKEQLRVREGVAPASV